MMSFVFHFKKWHEKAQKPLGSPEQENTDPKKWQFLKISASYSLARCQYIASETFLELLKNISFYGAMRFGRYTEVYLPKSIFSYLELPFASAFFFFSKFYIIL